MVYSIHLGHSKKNTLLGAAWMISAFRQSISIINLLKSVYLFKLSFFILSNVIAFLGPIWFVNLNADVGRYVKFSASNCGELAITDKWIRGAVSNYWSTFNNYRLIAHVPESVLSSKYNKFKSFFNNWHFSRFSWPRALFLSTVNNSYFPAHESATLKIPSIGIVDTNSWSQIVSLPVPGNDESVFSLIFYNDVISNYILLRKFSLVLMWFLNLRSASRIMSFSRWLRSQYVKTSKLFNPYKDFTKLFQSNTNNLYKGVSLFLSKNMASVSVFEKLAIFSASSGIKDFSSIMNSLLNRRHVLHKALNLNFVKKVISRKKALFRRKFLSDIRFKTKFLKKKFRVLKYLRSTYTLGKFRPFKIFLDTKLFKNQSFFLKKLADLFFFNKYKKHIVSRYLRRSYLVKKPKFNFISKLVKVSINNDKFSSTTSFFKLNKVINKSKTKKYFFYKALQIFYLKKYLWNNLLKKKAYFSVMSKKNLVKLFHNVFKQRLSFSKVQTSYLIKINNSNLNSKLKFFVHDFFFDNYIKASLTWNLRSFLPRNNVLSKYLFTHSFFGFFKRTIKNNVPVLFQGFLRKKLRKYSGTVHYRGLSVWMWH